MGNLRPFQIIILGIFVVLAALGLYLFASYQGLTGSSSVGVVNIWGTLPQTAVQGAVDAMKSDQRFAKVNYRERPEATFDSDIANAIASGSGPDIILINQEQLLAEKSKLMVIPFKTIPERTYKDSYASIAELFLTPEGTYGIPVAIDPLVLYYNRTLISRAGFASPPSSWEQVLGATPALTTKNGGNVIQSSIALGTYENIENARGILSLLFLQSGTSITTSFGTQGLQSTLNNGQGAGSTETPAQSALNFYTQFADPAKMVYTWNRALGSARTRFLSGNSAMYVGYASEREFLRAANPNLDFDMTTIPSPQTSSTRVDYARTYVLAIPKNGGNVAGAYTVASTLALGQYASKLAASLGSAPALRSLLSTRPGDVNADVYYPLALVSKGWLSPSPVVTDKIFADMINSVISGGVSAQQALANANNALFVAIQ